MAVINSNTYGTQIYIYVPEETDIDTTLCKFLKDIEYYSNFINRPIEKISYVFEEENKYIILYFLNEPTFNF